MTRPVLLGVATVVAALASIVTVAGLSFVFDPSRGHATSRWIPMVTNHRGLPVPAILGWAATAGIALGVVAGTFGDAGAHRLSFGAASTLEILAAILVVFAAGAYDDTRPRRTRGLFRQLAALRRGRVTPGLVKLVAIVIAAGLLMIPIDVSLGRAALGVPVVAGAANLWNLLDVAPGRSLKWFLPAAAILLGLRPGGGFAIFLFAAAAAALVVLPADLGERGMLGDAGANVLGFVVGAALVLELPAPWLAVALAVLLVLHLLADTVTLSRIIDRTAPLRWFDRLGRLPDLPADRNGSDQAADQA